MNMSIFSKTYQPRKIQYARSPRLKIHHKEKQQQQQQQQQQHTRKLAEVENELSLPEQLNFMQQFDCALDFSDKTSTQQPKKYEKEQTLRMQGNRYSHILLSDEATDSTLPNDVGVGVENTSSDNVLDICDVGVGVEKTSEGNVSDICGVSYEELQSTNPIFQSHKDKKGRRNGVSQRTELDVQMLTDMRLGIVSKNDEVVNEEEGES